MPGESRSETHVWTDFDSAFVAFRDGETTECDWIAPNEGYLAYGVGDVVRYVPWDLVEFAEKSTEDPNA